jgi:hypothetical protein
MRKWLCILIPIILTSMSCGQRNMSAHIARGALTGNQELEKEDLEIGKIAQASGSEAIVETRLKTAFRFEKVGKNWIAREVKLGHGQWVKIENLANAINELKTEETGKMLDQIIEAIKKYRKDKGCLPEFKDYISLSDLLSPAYLTPLIRLDSWRRPLAAKRTEAGAILIISAGPDGSFDNKDDIIRAIS